MRGSRLLIALTLAVAACTGQPPVVTVSVPSPVAVGGSVAVVVDSDDAPVALRAITFDPPGVIESIEPGVVAAIAAGETTASLEVDVDGDARTLIRQVEARIADAVAVTPSLRGAPCATPVTYTVGVQTEVPFELRAGATRLYGEGLLPFAVSGATLDLSRSGEGVLRLALPAAPGTATVTSSIDPAFALSLEVVAPTVIDELVVGPWTDRLPVLGVAALPIDVRVAGHALCADTLSRTFASLTPATCLVLDARGEPATSVTAPSLPEVRVRGIAPGVCTVSVALGGTPLTATTTLTVAM